MPRHLKTKSTGARGLTLSADDFVIALVDRLIKTEKRLDEMQKQLDEQFTMIAEIQPKVTPEGLVTLRAMKVVDDNPEEITVTVPVLPASQETR